MFKLANCLVEVTCYPYRTAQVIDSVFSIDRFTDEAYAFEEKLAEKAGVSRDNHVVYTLKDRKGNEIHIQCSSEKMKIGSKILIENW